MRRASERKCCMKSINEYKFEDISIGHEETFEVSITKDMEDNFRHLTGDVNPLHFDDEFAKKTGNYPSHVTFGMLTASMLSTLAGVYLPGKYSLIHSVEVGFTKPVFVGDTLTVIGTVENKQDGLNLLMLKVAIKNQTGKTVVKGKMKVKVLK